MGREMTPTPFFIHLTGAYTTNRPTNSDMLE